LFWEVMLLPWYFLIVIGGGPRREYATIKFFLFTFLGSLFILIALLGFYFTDIHDVVAPPDAGGPRPEVVRKAMDKLRQVNPALSDKEAEERARGQIDQKYKNSFDLI